MAGKISRLRQLSEGYCVKEISEEAFNAFMNLHEQEFFKNCVDFDVFGALDGESQNNLKNLDGVLKTSSFTLFLGAFFREELVGVHTGNQKSKATYHMGTSIIREAHQGKGLYQTMIAKVIEISKEKGFLRVSSHHNMSNNSVIVPKLKADFIITGMQVVDAFGVMIEMEYRFNENHKRALDFRIGQRGLDAKTSKHFKNLICNE